METAQTEMEIAPEMREAAVWIASFLYEWEASGVSEMIAAKELITVIQSHLLRDDKKRLHHFPNPKDRVLSLENLQG